jgi:hypothetical protein
MPITHTPAPSAYVAHAAAREPSSRLSPRRVLSRGVREAEYWSPAGGVILLAIASGGVLAGRAEVFTRAEYEREAARLWELLDHADPVGVTVGDAHRSRPAWSAPPPADRPRLLVLSGAGPAARA